MIYKQAIQNYYLRDKLDNHNDIKNEILVMIHNAHDGNLIDNQNNQDNQISKLDWNSHADFDRPWVKLLLPSLIDKLGLMAYSMGYEGIFMKSIWYQQYEKNSIHDWHVHSENYTGVYYLEYPNGAPATELFDTKLNIPNVSEGDVVMFPSMTPHRAPRVTSDLRKTIVSYNFNVHQLNQERLKQVKNV